MNNMNLITSRAAKQGGRNFYINCFDTAANSQYSFFDPTTFFPFGSDMDDGSSFGTPSGSIPTNQVNYITRKLAINNPFYLKKIRIKHTYSATPYNTSPLTLFLNIANVEPLGKVSVQRLDEVRVIDEEDEQTLVFDYEVNQVIDGLKPIQLQYGSIVPAFYTGCTLTFYVEAIADVYAMQKI